MWLSMRFLPMKMLLSNMIISDVILTCQLLIAWGYSHFISISCLQSETCQVLVRRYLDLIWRVNLVKRYPIVAIEYEKNEKCKCSRNSTGKMTWKYSGCERDSNPRPLRCRCNALPTELSKPHESGRVWVRPVMFSGRNTRPEYTNSVVNDVCVNSINFFFVRNAECQV